MAKKLKKKTVIIPVEEPQSMEVIPEVKEIIAPVLIPKVEETEITAFSSSDAEQLQKDGWQLIDCHRTIKGKIYKFKKVSK